MGGRIILHVGAPKTGSTYLQRRLRAGGDALRAQGVHVPVLPVVAAMAGNAKLLATVLCREPTLSFRRAFPDLDSGRLTPERVLGELLADWRLEREDVILSAEDFKPGHAGRLRGLLPPSAPVVVVLVVRRQDLWLQSYYNQLIKTHDITGAPEPFVSRLCRTDDEHPCRPDWLAHYEAWREAFEATRVVSYDAEAPRLYEAFCAAAGLEPAPDLPDIGRVKPSMNALQLAYLADLPAGLDHPDFLRRRAACEEVSRRDGVALRAPVLGRAVLQEVRARYEASNARLAERLGRPELQPFLRLEVSPEDGEPLAELRRTAAYQAFRDAVEALHNAPVQARP